MDTKTRARAGAANDSFQWWTVVQAVAWIVWRSLAVVERASGVRTFAALQRLQELRPVSVGGEPPISLAAATAELNRAIKDGRVGIYGRRLGNGELKRISMRGHLQAPWLTDYGNEVRLSNETMTRDRDYWADLWVRSDECMNRWPGDATANEARQVNAAPPVPSRKYGGKASQGEHDAWFASYRDKCVAAGKSPNSKADEIAGREALGSRFDRDRARNSRRRLAPPDWRSTGKRTGKI